MLTVYDRVKETTTTTGTGTYGLGGAATGFQAFSDAFTTGDTTYYCAEDGTDWEVGLGTLTTGTPWTLARTTILASSNADAAVDWSAGSKNIFCTQPAGKAVYLTADGILPALDGSALTGISASPAGADTQVMFNDGGSFGGDTGFTFDKTNNALTLGGATVTTSNPVLNLTQTWNAGAVTFTGLKFNVTDTASAAASLLLDLQVGSTSKAYIVKTGAFRSANNGEGFTINVSGQPVIGIGRNTSVGGLALYANGVSDSASAQLLSGGFLVPSTSYIGFATTAVTQPVDVALYRDAANTLALRNSTNAQEFRTYGTYTSATQYHYNAIKTAKTTLTATAGATITATNLIPDGAFLIGVTTRVNTTCTTATGYTVGDGVDPDLWGVAAAVAAGTATKSSDFTAAGACGLYIAAQSVVITATGGNFDGTGAIEVVAHYLITEAD